MQHNIISSYCTAGGKIDDFLLSLLSLGKKPIMNEENNRILSNVCLKQRLLISINQYLGQNNYVLDLNFCFGIGTK